MGSSRRQRACVGGVGGASHFFRQLQFRFTPGECNEGSETPHSFRGRFHDDAAFPCPCWPCWPRQPPPLPWPADLQGAQETWMKEATSAPSSGRGLQDQELQRSPRASCYEICNFDKAGKKVEDLDFGPAGRGARGQVRSKVSTLPSELEPTGPGVGSRSCGSSTGAWWPASRSTKFVIDDGEQVHQWIGYAASAGAGAHRLGLRRARGMRFSDFWPTPARLRGPSGRSLAGRHGANQATTAGRADDAGAAGGGAGAGRQRLASQTTDAFWGEVAGELHENWPRPCWAWPACMWPARC